MASGTEASAAIAARFGPDVLAADGSIDRAKLGPIVFKDPSARRELEAMVHPAVYRAITAGLRAFELTGAPPVAVVDIPLLFETGHAADFDRVLVVACTVPTQVARLLERGLTEVEARQRIAAQWPTEDKVKHADFVIRTDGSHEATDEQIDEFCRTLGLTSS
jgi:dephospho-CoA kinase